MKSDERPNKIRKTSHEKRELIDQLPDLYQGPFPSAPQSKADQVTPSEKPATKPDPSVKASEALVQSEEQNDVVSNSENAATSSQANEPLSKNQLKKLRKRQEWDAGRADRRAKRKEKTKERRERKREERDALAASGQTVQPSDRAKNQPRVRLPVTFLIDCGFDDKMMEKEMISLGSQITRSYSENSRAPFAANLVVSSWGGKLKERFETVLAKQYRNWKGITFDEEDFIHAAEVAKSTMARKDGVKMAGVFEKYAETRIANGSQNKKPDRRLESCGNGTNGTVNTSSVLEAPHSHIAASQEDTNGNGSIHAGTTESEVASTSTTTPLPEPEVVYLTSDSPNTLTHLSPYSTYIIGGIVDKNRHKGLCYKLACDRGVKHAKLPIGEFMEMQSRFVLATNHVVEIMVRWLECGDWGEAFMKVIPKRKGGKLKGESGEVEGEAVEEDGGEKDENEDVKEVGGSNEEIDLRVEPEI